MIETTAEFPPVPDRSHDWRASLCWNCGDDDQPTGWGETEEKAILNLLNQMTEFDDNGECAEELVDLAFEGTEYSKAKRKQEETERWEIVASKISAMGESMQRSATKENKHADHLAAVADGLKFALDIVQVEMARHK